MEVAFEHLPHAFERCVPMGDEPGDLDLAPLEQPERAAIDRRAVRLLVSFGVSKLTRYSPDGLLSGAPPAVDHEGAARHERGFVAREIED